ncbi:class I SAM-dependent methyltransferase [Craurococcus roseus]|uniref:Class I SAM-dependent methyltransferase n=1 Tax=Craurococcus roseus TaxID=77585 RepID=A0ABP3Q9I5_9PROT
MLRERSTADEWMDDASATEAEFGSALADLERINRMSLAYRPVLRWLDRVAEAGGPRRLSVLDVGAGGGDMLEAVAAWGAKRGVALDVAGLDRSPWAASHAEKRGRPGRWITADLFDLDPAERFDVVLCSLFAHHLPDPVLVRFLRWMDARATRGWLISDLHRHPVPWAFVWAGVRVLRMDPMVVHDSTVSIARGFTRADWEKALREAGVEAEIRWAFPFRWQVGKIRA